MGRPMSRRLMESLTSVIDKEKKKQAIVFEFTPNVSQSHDKLVDLLDNINLQVIQIEKLLGKENRISQLTYESQGLNLRTALIQMSAWVNQHAPENKLSDRHFDEVATKIKAINDGLRKKLDNQSMNLQILKEIKELYELYKGLIKYDQIIDRSLVLARSWDKLTLMQEERPYDFEAIDAKSHKLKDETKMLQSRVANVVESISTSFAKINTKLQEIENKMKTKL